MALAFLVYELNKGATSTTDQNVREAEKMMRVRKSIVKERDDYLSLYETIPTLEVTGEMNRLFKRVSPERIHPKTANAKNRS